MRRLYFTLALLLVTLAACGQNAPQTGSIGLASPPPAATAVEAVTSVASFADALRASGANVTAEGDVALGFLHGDGEILRVGEETVQVYEYTDEALTNTDAARFSLDGAWVNSDQGSTLINWFATPHLYRASRLIAVYVGDHTPTLELLEDVLGAPFAGGANPYHAAAMIRLEE